MCVLPVLIAVLTVTIGIAMLATMYAMFASTRVLASMASMWRP
jgi:hypothetical protein